MKATCRCTLMLTLVLVLTAGLALAKPNGNKRVSVTLTTVTVMPDGAQLQPGNYRMELLNDSSTPQVAFYQNNKLVCKCPVKVQNAPSKIPFTKLLYDIGADGSHILNTLEVGGWNQVLVFSGHGPSGTGL
jgi:hypothetical protein